MTSATHALVPPGGPRSPWRAGRRGQSLVEAALTMPLVITLCLGIADGGRAFYYREAVTNATRQAVRVASQTRAAGDTACQSVPSAGTITVSAHIPSVAGDSAALTTASSIATAAALEGSSDGTAAGSKLAAANTTVSVTFHCSATGAVYTNASATTTDPTQPQSAAIEAKVSYHFSLITPLVSGLFPNTTISDDVVGRAGY